MGSSRQGAPGSLWPRQSSPEGFRSDIGGLRGLAILLVVAFHVKADAVPAGYLGVDVFFVISGFLITTSMLDEHRRSGGLDLPAFWARRVRRLVPALALVVSVSLAASAVVLSPLELAQVGADAVRVVTYTFNLSLARDGSDYFAPDRSASVFLHGWSLGVEEQFYLVWPPVLLAALTIIRRAPARLGGEQLVVGGALLVGSFGLALHLTQQGSSWAFFGLPTRVWEVGVGALLASGAAWFGARDGLRRAAPWLRSGGLVAIVWASWAFDGYTPHPGWGTVVPVAGTALVIAVGGGAAASRRGLGLPALGYIGDISYSWYLWHWPAIVLAVAAAGDSVVVRVVAAIVSLALADVTTRLVENPIRYSPTLRRSVGGTFAVGLGASAVALVGVVALGAYAERGRTTPLMEQLASAQADTAPGYARSRCVDTVSPLGVSYCALGSDDGPVVMLLGDSHAAAWAPGLDAVGRRLGVRLVVRTLGGCPAPPVSVAGFSVRSVELPGCSEYRARTATLIEELSPAAVVFSARSVFDRVLDDRGRVTSASDQVQRWRDATSLFTQSLREGGIAVGAILDTPSFRVDPIACAGRQGSISGCGVTRQTALEANGAFREAERGATLEAGGTVFDPIDLVCSATHCEPTADGVMRYSDASHLTASYVVSLEPLLERFVDGVLATSPSSPGSATQLAQADFSP